MKPEQEIKQVLQEHKPFIWQEIDGFLSVKEPEFHYRMVRDYPERQGKYFRATLLMLNYLLYGGEDLRSAYKLSAVLQLAEDWLLIHDDFEDQSEERRSTVERKKPTLHKLHGNELAVNAGDSLHILMWRKLGELIERLPSERYANIHDYMARILIKATEGQARELFWIKNRVLQVEEQDYLKMVKEKTCYYTTIGPCVLAGILAGLSEERLRKVKAWSELFGYAFQLWDDVMNLRADSVEQGKETAGDILEGKRTLILIRLLQKCSEVERREIEKIYLKNRSEKTLRDQQTILDLMNNYQVIDEIADLAKQYAEKALMNFDNSTEDCSSPRKQQIKQLIRFTVNRSR